MNLAEREGFEKDTLEVLGKAAKVTHIKILPDHPMSTEIHQRLWRYTGAGRILVAFATRARMTIKNPSRQGVHLVVLFGFGGPSTMENTNPKQLRAELKNFLDLASGEPVRIQRRSGEAFVLMNESQYAQMQNEILSLQRRLLGMSDALAGKGKEYVPGSGERLRRFSKSKSKKK